MKIYDKASWHIDGGENAVDVIRRFLEVFKFLQEKKMLTADGIETVEYAMDSSVSLNSMMVTLEGNEFLERYYDGIIALTPKQIRENLFEAYRTFVDEK